ncbi:MAG: lipoprotein-releasing system ATP-binding protein [bacterium P3]|nr:MAG: lipoprotein-releasing system ATP-binding protein [bacterium P3]KWW42443.1 MAG: lipoprotein-releasing system ATP-binding protein [bacterium F083]
MITATHINKSYGSLQVLHDVSLSVGRGEVVSIVGASGAGKTTLLQILGSLDRPDSGQVFYSLTSGSEPQRVDIVQLPERQLAEFRNRHIGFVFQSHNLLPEFTALENICIPALIAGVSMREAQRRAMELLAFLRLEARAGHKPAALSGGEQQRVSVARALINRPDIVLADEPSGNLDSVHARELHRLFFTLREQYNQSFVIVTHNPELAEMADRKIWMKDGQNISSEN